MTAIANRITVAALLRSVIAVLVAKRRALRRMKSRLAALFIIGRRHRRRRIQVLRRWLRERRQWLQLWTRPIPIRSLDRVEFPVRGPVHFRRCSAHGFATRGRMAGLDGADIEEARRRCSGIVRKALRTASSAIDEFLRLGRVLDSVAIQKKRECREHSERDYSDGDCNRHFLC